MNWLNLKNNKCPSCSCFLTRAPFSSTASSYCNSCNFRISSEKFDKIVNGLYKKKRSPTYEENLSELNNLGREKMSEDFSDSPTLL